MITRYVLGSLVAAAVAVGIPRGLVEAAEFYKDKQIRLVVGTDAGGGYDFSARLISRHIARSIPGNPQIVVQNMPGADSLVAANFIYNVAPQDGTVVGAVVQTLPQTQLFGDKNVKFDSSKFEWIGTPSSSVSVIATWHTAPVKTFQDARTTPIVMGASGQVGLDYTLATMLNSVLGTKFQVVSGYKGGNEVELAMERGEVSGRAGQAWAGWKVTRPDWIKERKLNLLAQIGLTRAKDLPDIPLVLDFAETDEQRQILTLFSSTVALGRPLVLGPRVAAEHVATMRESFRKTVSDPLFLADAAKAGYDVGPIFGEEMQMIVTRLMATPTQVAARAKAAITTTR